MNLPNKLTIFRVILVIPFVALMLNGYDLWAVAVFIIASLTDLLDGKIARKYNLITDFGKFMDPLADKLLVCAAMICLVEMGRLPAWMVIVIISREFIISGFRLVVTWIALILTVVSLIDYLVKNKQVILEGEI